MRWRRAAPDSTAWQAVARAHGCSRSDHFRAVTRISYAPSPPRRGRVPCARRSTAAAGVPIAATRVRRAPSLCRRLRSPASMSSVATAAALAPVAARVPIVAPPLTVALVRVAAASQLPIRRACAASQCLLRARPPPSVEAPIQLNHPTWKPIQLVWSPNPPTSGADADRSNRWKPTQACIYIK